MGSQETQEAVGAAAVYDAMADAYAGEAEANAYNDLYERPATIALLPPVRGRDVLDAGCGSGPLSAWLAGAGARVTGFDASERMVALAQARRLPRAAFLVADLAAPLPFADDAFDVAVASLVLHYLRDWVAPLASCAASCVPAARWSARPTTRPATSSCRGAAATSTSSCSTTAGRRAAGSTTCASGGGR